MQLNYTIINMLDIRVLSRILILFILGLSAVKSFGQSKLEVKEDFYVAMSASDLAMVNDQLLALEKLAPNAESAYKGALLMKKAALLDQPGEKLNTFKTGREMLEKAIAADPANPEFRFLRIMIQENAPKILGYDQNLSEDAEVVSTSFQQMNNVLQTAVINYSKNSEILNTKG